MATDDVEVRVRPPKRTEPRHPTRRRMTDAESEALATYPASQRRDLLRRLRAKELWIAPDGLLHEVNQAQRDHRRREARAAGARDQAKRKARRAAGRARSRNRR